MNSRHSSETERLGFSTFAAGFTLIIFKSNAANPTALFPEFHEVFNSIDAKIHQTKVMELIDVERHTVCRRNAETNRFEHKCVQKNICTRCFSESTNPNESFFTAIKFETSQNVISCAKLTMHLFTPTLKPPTISTTTTTAHPFIVDT